MTSGVHRYTPIDNDVDYSIIYLTPVHICVQIAVAELG